MYADVVAGNGTAGGGLGPVVQPAGFESGGQRENKFCGPRERSPSVKSKQDEKDERTTKMVFRM